MKGFYFSGKGAYKCTEYQNKNIYLDKIKEIWRVTRVYYLMVLFMRTPSQTAPAHSKEMLWFLRLLVRKLGGQVADQVVLGEGGQFWDQCVVTFDFDATTLPCLRPGVWKKGQAN